MKDRETTLLNNLENIKSAIKSYEKRQIVEEAIDIIREGQLAKLELYRQLDRAQGQLLNLTIKIRKLELYFKDSKVTVEKQ